MTGHAARRSRVGFVLLLRAPPASAQGYKQRRGVLQALCPGLYIIDPGLVVLGVGDEDLHVVGGAGLEVDLNQLQRLRCAFDRMRLGKQSPGVMFQRPQDVRNLLKSTENGLPVAGAPVPMADLTAVVRAI